MTRGARARLRPVGVLTGLLDLALVLAEVRVEVLTVRQGGGRLGCGIASQDGLLRKENGGLLKHLSNMACGVAKDRKLQTGALY